MALPPSCAKEFHGHSKIVKQVKRRRDREPSRLPTRSYFSERNSVSFPERYSQSEKGWRFDILCMRSPGVKGIFADALLCDSLSCQSLRFVLNLFNEKRKSYKLIQVFYT